MPSQIHRPLFYLGPALASVVLSSSSSPPSVEGGLSSPASHRRPVRREHLWEAGRRGSVHTRYQRFLFPASLWNRRELFVSSDGSVATLSRELRESDLYIFYFLPPPSPTGTAMGVGGGGGGGRGAGEKKRRYKEKKWFAFVTVDISFLIL